MVGPSARGSLKGTPSSMMSAPASARARANLCVASSEGSPAVMYATMPSSPSSRSSAKRLEIRVELARALVMVFAGLKRAFIRVHVLIAAAGEIEDNEVGWLELRQAFDEAGDGVGGFKRGNDAFGARKELGGIESGLIGNGGVFGAALIGEPGVFGPGGGIVETRGNGMRSGDLAVFVLQDVGVSALEDAGARAGETLMRGEARGVLSEAIAAAAGFDAYHFHVGVSQEFVE